jgi:hypothetical protein
MGQAVSTHDSRHVRIWNNLNALTAPASRLQALDTLMQGPEYVEAAKRAGIYADLLGWMNATRRGQSFAWPRPYAPTAAPTPAPVVRPPVPVQRAPVRPQAPPPTLRIHDTAPPSAGGPSSSGRTELARVPPPKRALDVLHESYAVLGLDDSKPLTHETLRKAYKNASLTAHPDKGGSAEQFDEINRAFGYLQEVLNKLLPKSGTEGADPRFTMMVSPEAAMVARGTEFGGGGGGRGAAPGALPVIEDAPQIALNPKKLDLALFNKLFDEHKLPDPDKTGYGDWLKSADGRNDANVSIGRMGGDNFNSVFAQHAMRATNKKTEELTAYKPPKDLILSPGFGTEIGADRPAQFTKGTGTLDGGGLAYTDLMHAYGDGSTFSQDIGMPDLLSLPKEAPLPGRARTMAEAERDYSGAPGAMTAEQAAAVRSFDMAREQAERARQHRAAARDVDVERAHDRLKGRLMIRE